MTTQSYSGNEATPVYDQTVSETGVDPAVEPVYDDAPASVDPDADDSEPAEPVDPDADNAADDAAPHVD